jgi:hypothetical protein
MAFEGFQKSVAIFWRRPNLLNVRKNKGSPEQRVVRMCMQGEIVAVLAVRTKNFYAIPYPRHWVEATMNVAL